MSVTGNMILRMHGPNFDDQRVILCLPDNRTAEEIERDSDIIFSIWEANFDKMVERTEEYLKNQCKA